MRPPPRFCPNCGARVLKPGAQAACDYCETRLELSIPTRVVERAARFARLKADPSLPELLRRPVGGGGQLVTASFLLLVVGGMVVFGVLFAVVASQGPRGFVILPLVFVAVTLFAFVRLLRRTSVYASDPGRAIPALVVDERIDVRGGKHTSTQCYATIETEDGERGELETSDEVAGRIAPGDSGVAYVRGGVLVHFARVEA